MKQFFVEADLLALGNDALQVVALSGFPNTATHGKRSPVSIEDNQQGCLM